MAQKMIDDYRNLTGEHCGTTAMRNLMHYYCGLELEEHTIFGLGSGLDLLTIEFPRMDPPFFMSGRSITMEVDACSALGIDYREQPESDNEKAWTDVKEQVLAGRPTMLSGDIFFLDYRNYKVRFPAHRFVLLGFDDESRTAFIADRVDAEPQPCSYGALTESRNPSSGITTLNLWGCFHDSRITRTMEDACRQAVRTTVDRMTGADTSQTELLKSVLPRADMASGLEGLHRFRQWIDILPDHEQGAFMASYFYQTIEKFGSGGSNFRRFHARFLNRANRLVPDIVDEAACSAAKSSADRWSALGKAFAAIAESPEKAKWRAAANELDAVISLESKMVESLAGSGG